MFSKLKPTKGSKDSVSVAEMARQEQSAQSPKVLLQGQDSGCLKMEAGDTYRNANFSGMLEVARVLESFRHVA
jgi:hypothetical protein